jgi:hypothetical protein
MWWARPVLAARGTSLCKARPRRPVTTGPLALPRGSLPPATGDRSTASIQDGRLRSRATRPASTDLTTQAVPRRASQLRSGRPSPGKASKSTASIRVAIGCSQCGSNRERRGWSSGRVPDGTQQWVLRTPHPGRSVPASSSRLLTRSDGHAIQPCGHPVPAPGRVAPSGELWPWSAVRSSSTGRPTDPCDRAT